MLAWIGRNRSIVLAILVLFTTSLLLRVVLLLSTDTLLGQDADGAGYAGLARMIASADFSHDDGSRTPGYPLLIAVLGGQPESIRIAQVLLGLLTTGVLFLLGWQISGSALVAFCLGAYYGLNLTQARYEASLLTEVLTVFLLSVCFLYVSRVRGARANWTGRALVLIGLLAGLPGLVRPAFAFLPLLLAPLVLPSVRPRLPHFYYLAPALIPILVWSSFNQVRFGMFSPSTVLGFNLANHSGAYIEYASDKYSVIKEAYRDALPYYRGDAQRINLLHQAVDCSTVAEGQACTVQSKIRRVTNQSVPELSRTLTQMTVEIFSAHPDWYVLSASRAWLQFWSAPSWPEGLAHDQNLDWWLRRASLAEKVMVILTNAVFLASMSIFAIYAALRRKLLVSPLILVMAGTVSVASVLSALIDPAEMTRYGTPLQPFAACLALTAILTMRRLGQARRSGHGGLGRVAAVQSGLFGAGVRPRT